MIGATEAAAGEVSMRLRDGRKLPPMASAEALRKIRSQVEPHSAQLLPS